MIKNLYSFLFVDDLLDTSVNSMPVKQAPVMQKLMRDLARFTMFAYVLLVFNPVMPLIADKMAHTFWEEYHLITVHHIYGNTHVNIELSKITKQADKNKSSASKTSYDEHFHVIPAVTPDFLCARLINRSFLPYKFSYPISYSDIKYQPPKAS